VQLAGEPDAQREFVKLGNSMFQRNDIVSNFAQVFRATINSSSCFGSQQFSQRGLSAFDPARQNGFTPDEGMKENVRVGQPPAIASKSTNEAIRMRASRSVEASN
jgi:hypothetical protein